MIGLVPCAVGGTSIKEWQQGTDLYNHLLSRAEASVVSGGKIKALLWYQGESDTENAEDSELYGGRLKKFFTDIRSDLKIPLLPIIQVLVFSCSLLFEFDPFQIQKLCLPAVTYDKIIKTV